MVMEHKPSVLITLLFVTVFTPRSPSQGQPPADEEKVLMFCNGEDHINDEVIASIRRALDSLASWLTVASRYR